jgi:hypothetical protein
MIYSIKYNKNYEKERKKPSDFSVDNDTITWGPYAEL